MYKIINAVVSEFEKNGRAAGGRDACAFTYQGLWNRYARNTFCSLRECCLVIQCSFVSKYYGVMISHMADNTDFNIVSNYIPYACLKK